MRRVLIALALPCLAALPVAAGETRPYVERELGYQLRFCAGMEIEVRVPRGIADCVSATHAIEVDFDGSWKTGLGQALAYAAAKGLRPGIILVCGESEATCRDRSLGLRETVSAFGLPLTIWECSPADRSIEACLRRECGDDGC